MGKPLKKPYPYFLGKNRQKVVISCFSPLQHIHIQSVLKLQKVLKEFVMN